MKEFPSKNLSLLGLVLTAASAVTAAVIPNKNNKEINNGTLRAYSATIAGADRDAANSVISCILIMQSIMSCTATGSVTTTGFSSNQSLFLLAGQRFTTINNTSQTNPNDGVDQNSDFRSIDTIPTSFRAQSINYKKIGL